MTDLDCWVFSQLLTVSTLSDRVQRPSDIFRLHCCQGSIPIFWFMFAGGYCSTVPRTAYTVCTVVVGIQ
jgi:hypothetical protein